MSRAPYRVGIVGCGGMGRAHANAFQDTDRATVVGAAEVNESVREAFAEQFDVPVYAEFGELLGEASLDIVSVCTWHSTHAEITIEAAKAGVDGVLCEKPMSTSMGEARDMIDAADRNDAKLAVAHQRRFQPIHETARELLAEGAIGDPVVVTAANDDGLLNFGTHMVDLARYLLDDPGTEWVMGQVERRTDRHERRVPIEDRCVGHVCFEDGVRLVYESDMPGPDLGEASLRVTGTAGVLRLDLGTSVTVVNGDGIAEYEPEPSGSARRTLIRTFVEWIEGGREDYRCRGSEAGNTMEILLSIYESARTNGVVRTPLETRANPLECMIEDGELPLDHPGRYDIRLPYSSVRERE